MIHSYKMIFFDAGGTLLYPYPSVGGIYHRVASRYGYKATSEEIQSRFLACWEKLDGISKLSSDCDEKVERDWWRNLVGEVFSAFGTIRNFEIFFEELYSIFASPESWRLYPEVHEVLGALKQSGKRLAVISNWDSRLFRLCESLAIQPYFDFVFASAVVGASKPGTRIFEEALKKADVSPHEAVHVGDSFEDDVKGAMAAGIPAILIDRHSRNLHSQKLAVQPLAMIRDLRSLIP